VTSTTETTPSTPSRSDHKITINRTLHNNAGALIFSAVEFLTTNAKYPLAESDPITLGVNMADSPVLKIRDTWSTAGRDTTPKTTSRSSLLSTMKFRV
jgi:hypothetical protein